MKRKKRYNSESEIIADIDLQQKIINDSHDGIYTARRETEEHGKRIAQIEQLLGEQKQLTGIVKGMNKEIYNRKRQITQLKDRINEFKKAVGRGTRKLEGLKKTLAAFNTIPMSFSDESVVLQ